MKWFNRWFAKKCRQAWEEAEPQDKVPAIRGGTALNTSNENEWGNGLNIRLYKANGGRIVSFNVYDQKTDRHKQNTYIITDEQDFTHELAKIITMESLRH